MDDLATDCGAIFEATAFLSYLVTTQVAYLPSILDMLGRKDRAAQISWPIGGLGADSN